MPATDTFSDQEILAKTIFGEARGEIDEGKKAIACVVLNRVDSGVTWWGHDIRSICLAPYQFSCWNIGDPNRATIMAATEENPVYARCLEIAGDAIKGLLIDNTNGADSYEALGTDAYWARRKTPVAVIGHHAFFKTVDVKSQRTYGV